MRLSVSFFICFLIGISGYTQNDSGLTEVLKQLNLKEGHIKSEFVRIKALPHRPEDVIYLIPEIIEEDDNYSYTLHPHIVIVDINSHILE